MINLSIQQNVIQEHFTRAAYLFAGQNFKDAIGELKKLQYLLVENQPHLHAYKQKQLIKKCLSDCYLNMAICQINMKNEGNLEAESLLKLSINKNYLNAFSYFNLSSILFLSNNFKQSYNQICCALSCLYVCRASITTKRDIKSRQNDLIRSIHYAENNIEAHIFRMILNFKQNKLKLALNELNWALDMDKQNQILLNIKQLMTKFTQNITNEDNQKDQNIYRQCLQMLSRFTKHIELDRLNSGVEIETNGDIEHEIVLKTKQFSDLLNDISLNETMLNLLNFKTVFKINIKQQANHLISNATKLKGHSITHLTQSPVMVTNSQSIDKHYGKNNDSLPSLQIAPGESLFELTKSNNNQIDMDSSNKVFNGDLLSSLGQSRYNPALTASLQEYYSKQTNKISPKNQQNPYWDIQTSGGMRKKMNIEVIESHIQPLIQNQEQLLDNSEQLQQNVSKSHDLRLQQEDLLLDSVYDAENRQNIEINLKIPHFNNEFQQNLQKKKAYSGINPNESQNQQTHILYPLEEANKHLELILVNVDLKKDEKVTGDQQIYAFLQYNHQSVEGSKYRSKTIRKQKINQQISQIYLWGENGQNLGILVASEEAKNMNVKVFKNEPLLYNDKLLGEGEIQITTIGTIRIPLYLNYRYVGSATIKLISISSQLLKASIKQGSNSIGSYGSSGFNSSVRSITD